MEHLRSDLAARALAIIQAVTISWATVHAVPADTRLEPGHRVERSIAADDYHSYALLPAADSARRLIVEQLGIDLVTVLSDADGQTLQELNNPLGRFDRESFRLTSEVAYLELKPVEGGVLDGRYAVTLELLGEPPNSELPGSELPGSELPGSELPGSEAPEGRFAVDIRRRAEKRMTLAATRPLRSSRDEMEEAAELYESAAADFASLGDLRAEARALLSAANFHRVLEDAKSAHQLYRQAQSRWQELAEAGFVADSLTGAGQTARRLGQTDQARNYLEQALEIFQQLGRGPERAGVLTNLGLLAQNHGDLRRALARYGEALEEQQRAGQRHEIAILLLNIGTVHARLGEAEPALENERQALTLFRELGDRYREGGALNNLAVLYRRMGEPETALSLYSQALRLAEELGDRRDQARALNNRGVTYFTLGDLDLAAHNFERALALRDDDLRGKLITLTNLGDVHYHRGDLQASRRRFEAALELARRLQHRHEVAILGHLGRLLARLGDPAAPRRFEEAHRLLAERDDPSSEALLHYRQGEGLLFTGNAQGARAALEKSLALWRQIGDPARQVTALTALGRAARSLGQLRTAHRHLSEALTLIESLRTEIAHPDLRASFLSSRHDAYTLSIDVLMALHAADPGAGYEREALELSERGHARRLLDLLREAEVDLEAEVAPKLAQQRQDLLRRLSLQARRQQLVTLGRQKLMPGEDLDAAIHETRVELDLVESTIRRQDPRRAALVPTVPLTANAMQQLLDSETALLHYSLGESRGYLWVVTSEAIDGFVLPPRVEIEALARRLREAWSTVGSTSTEAESALARSLAETLLGPAIDRLQGNRLAVIADGALHYIPFAGLPIPGDADRRLVERFEIVRVPSAAVLSTHRRASGPGPRPTKVTVIADPVFELADPRLAGLESLAPGTVISTEATRNSRHPSGEPETSVTRSAAPFDSPGLWLRGDFGRLPGTRLEAEAITAHVAPEQVRIALDFDASRDAVTGDLTTSTIVHFATHAVVDSGHPELSGLVLSQLTADGRRRTDGILRLPDIYRLDLEADLVVLSGCRTGLGRELRGEGLQGLTGGFFYAGARRVMASLWSVADRATAELMRHFYRSHLADGDSPATALRRAQLTLAADRRFQDPYFWAAFVLHGDWR